MKRAGQVLAATFFVLCVYAFMLAPVIASFITPAACVQERLITYHSVHQVGWLPRVTTEGKLECVQYQKIS